MRSIERLLAVVEWVCGASQRESVFEPLVADWQREWHDRPASSWARARILVGGASALGLSIAQCVLTAGHDADKRGAGRTSARAAAIVVFAGALLTLVTTGWLTPLAWGDVRDSLYEEVELREAAREQAGSYSYPSTAVRQIRNETPEQRVQRREAFRSHSRHVANQANLTRPRWNRSTFLMAGLGLALGGLGARWPRTHAGDSRGWLVVARVASNDDSRQPDAVLGERRRVASGPGPGLVAVGSIRTRRDRAADRKCT